MSYTPTLLIRKSDLEKYQGELESMRYCGNADKEQASEILLKALKYETVKFPEIELILVTTDFSSDNGNCRELMRELEIDFRIDN